MVCRAQTWALEGSRVTEQPASPPNLPSDKWPQHGLFISCLEKWTVPPSPASPPPLHMSANVIILRVRARTNSGEFRGTHTRDEFLALLTLRPATPLHTGSRSPLSSTPFAALCFFGSKPPSCQVYLGHSGNI